MSGQVHGAGNTGQAGALVVLAVWVPDEEGHDALALLWDRLERPGPKVKGSMVAFSPGQVTRDLRADLDRIGLAEAAAAMDRDQESTDAA